MTDSCVLAERGSDWSVDVQIGGVGDNGTWLLAGPPPKGTGETLVEHLKRLGPSDRWLSPSALRAVVRDSGLRGRGGGGFPLARKLETALLAPGEPILIVNASESEPASRKDATLCLHRPHLVLDGAAMAAAIIGSTEVVIYMHQGSTDVYAALQRALAERQAAQLADPVWRMLMGPGRYVAGEASAIANRLEGGEALPSFSPHPMAFRGPSGRPTVVNNCETVAQLALLVRMGTVAWRNGGTPSSPGPQLLTLVGAVADSEIVVEVVGSATVGQVLGHVGVCAPPGAVLVGGYAGTWLKGGLAWWTPLDRAALERVGASPGCGLVGVLPHGACGLSETAHLVSYLAGESAGQCGPCAHGLPALARHMEAIARGSYRQRSQVRLRSLGDAIFGAGACAHPDGVVRLIRSAFEAFDEDVQHHLDHRRCPGSKNPPTFFVPKPRRRS